MRSTIVLLPLCVLSTWCAALAADCDAGDVAVYRALLQTFWSEDRFPKHYPQYRPRAQWAQTFGQSHNSSYRLYELGEVATPELRDYAHTGHVAGLVEAGEEDERVYDQFAAPAIQTGVGKTENVFFVDGGHSLVSTVTRLVPSPDWFVGVDSLQLCVDGLWVDEVSLSLDPLDVGAASGLSFTAPHWVTEPPASVTRHTARRPAHPAAGFFYPRMRQLPTIATVHFTKIKEYSSKTLNDMVHQEMRGELLSEKKTKKKPPTTEAPQRELTTKTSLEILKDLEEEPVGTPRPNLPANHVEVVTEAPTTTPKIRTTTEGEFGIRTADDVVLAVASGKLLGYGHHLPRHFRHRLSLAVNRITEDDCLVSEWGGWSACSATCGFGERSRARRVLRSPTAPAGRACPDLAEVEHCGDANSCFHIDYFEW